MQEASGSSISQILRPASSSLLLVSLALSCGPSISAAQRTHVAEQQRAEDGLAVDELPSGEERLLWGEARRAVEEDDAVEGLQEGLAGPLGKHAGQVAAVEGEDHLSGWQMKAKEVIIERRSWSERHVRSRSRGRLAGLAVGVRGGTWGENDSECGTIGALRQCVSSYPAGDDWVVEEGEGGQKRPLRPAGGDTALILLKERRGWDAAGAGRAQRPSGAAGGNRLF